MNVYIVEIDYEDESVKTVEIIAETEGEAKAIAESDPEVKIARVHGNKITL